ncbi:MAG: sugar phosphate isomerase/epimerase [Actinomycetaceae bacterium]|nr:sugar phosphate isomerase/epimerase [Actinomycetaceae bacterium]MDY5853953.1 sugar phosphate isomerase/epimerase [Arcanobacterium sp.]
MPARVPALDEIVKDGLNGAEVNVGGFVPSPHCHVDLLLTSHTARDEYLGLFEEKGVKLAGINTSGNPVSPLPDAGPRHDYDLRRAIKLAEKLGVKEIVCMSGAPGSDPYARYPSWVVNPWDGTYLEILDYQFSVLKPYWQEMDKRAQDAGVKLAWELHPHNTIFTPQQFLNVIDDWGTKNIGVNMDPSHLFWQGVDVIESVKLLGEHILHVHAKDTTIEPGVATRGVLDPEFERWSDDEDSRYPSAMFHYCTSHKKDPAWRFTHVGFGHDVDWWSEFLTEIAAINPDMNVSIEHEDEKYSQEEGLRLGAETLIAAAQQAQV